MHYPAAGMNTVCVKFLIFRLHLDTRIVCSMGLSAPPHLLGVRYDSLDNLIHNIQIYASTQRYAVCRLRTVNPLILGY